MISVFEQLDLDILLYIQNCWRSDSLTEFFKFVTSGGSILLAVVAVWFILFGNKERRLLGFTAAISVAVDIALVNGFLKNVFERERPYVTYDEIIPLMGVLSDFSFPSGHTALSFALAFVFYRGLPKAYGIGAMMVAALVGFSRVYLGVHYFSDVLVGALVGCLAAYIAEKIIKRFYNI